jgi:hypothetical protein
LTAAEWADNPLLCACEQFKKATLELPQHICIFEDGRAAGEESFFA